MSIRLVRPMLGAGLAVLLVGGCGLRDAPLAPTAPTPAASGSLVGTVTEPVLGLPRLLYCPTETSETGRAVIGPDGGRLEVGRFRLDVPAGAVARTETFVLTVVPGTLLEIEAHVEGHASYQFAAPVAVTLDLSRCGTLLPSGLQAWHIDPATKTPLENMGGQLDLLGRSLEFRTPHFSGYSVAW